ncbi:MAG: repressor LexA [Deltaproteobacteria bacterium]|nr:repressor LexA [Deltaproteobacteria bacterium]
MAATLSERQAAVLGFLRDFWAQRSTSPTQREVADFLGVKTARGAAAHLKALVRKGYLDHDARSHRGYRLRLEQPRSTTPKEAPPQVTLSSAEVADRTVPVVGRVPGGAPSGQDVEDLGEVVSPVKVSARAFAVRIFGDSMRDAHIVDDDLVVVDPAVLAIDRRVVVALIDGEYTIKVLRRTADGEWWLEPANDHYRPIFPRIDDDRVEGVVVAVVRPSVGLRPPSRPW